MSETAAIVVGRQDHPTFGCGRCLGASINDAGKKQNETVGKHPFGTAETSGLYSAG